MWFFQPLLSSRLLVGLLAFLAFTRGFRFVVTLHNVLRLRFQRPAVRAATDLEVPGPLLEHLPGALPLCRSLGFDQPSWIALRESSLLRARERFEVLLTHANGTIARYGYASAPDELFPLRLTLHTFFTDGTSVMSQNGLATSASRVPAGTTLVDPALHSFAAFQRVHDEAVQRAQKMPLVLAPADAVARLHQHATALFDDDLAAGHLHEASDSTFEIPWLASLTVTWKALHQASLNRELRARLAAAPGMEATTPRVPVPIEEDLGAWEQQQVLANSPPRRNLTLWLFCVTALLSIASFSFGSGALVGLGLFAIILAHEFGHWGAMRLLGYRNTSIFFIPFLGGAASGTKDDASIHDELVVLLAGPLPGLLFALVALNLGAREVQWLHGLLAMSILLNLFNLLPLASLDGGRVVQALLGARSPLLGVAFRVLGVIVLGGLAWFTSDVWLGGFATLFALGLPGALRTADLRRRIVGILNESKAPVSEAPRVFFTLLREEKPPPSWAKKLSRARSFFAQPLRLQEPSWLVIVGWTAVYIASLAVGVAALMSLFVPYLH